MDQRDQYCGDANANGNVGVVNYNMRIMVSIRVGNELLWCRTAWRNQEQLHFTLEKGQSLLFYQHNIHVTLISVMNVVIIMISVVNVIIRWMFWSDWGREPKIERAGMDGSHR